MDDVIFNIIQSQLSLTVALPVIKVILEAVQSSGSKLSSVPNSTRCLEHMYHTQEDSAPFLFHHPVVSSSSKGRRQHLTPLDKEQKKLDVFGR